MNQDIRWLQRFDNFNRAYLQLWAAVELSKERELSLLEKQGMIQAFEYTHELAWKTLKDFLEYRGETEPLYGSKDVVRKAFQTGLISNGDDWMKMTLSRNLTVHTYNESTAEQIRKEIETNYIIRLSEFKVKMEELRRSQTDR